MAVAVLLGMSPVHAERVAERMTVRVNPAPGPARDLENDSVVSLKRVFYAAAKSDLAASDKTELRRVAERYRARPESVFELRGYSDRAEPDANVSLKRAVGAADFLAANGVPLENIRVLGLGAADGGAADNSEQRRVDVRVFVPAADDPRLKQLDAPDFEPKGL